MCMGIYMKHALVCTQGLLEMEFALPTDSTEASGLSLLRRLWVARFDVEEEGRDLAEKYVLWCFWLLSFICQMLILY